VALVMCSISKESIMSDYIYLQICSMTNLFMWTSKVWIAIAILPYVCIVNKWNVVSCEIPVYIVGLCLVGLKSLIMWKL
jgi:hypothetical protein